jgi:hypothetical protein
MVRGHEPKSKIDRDEQIALCIRYDRLLTVERRFPGLLRSSRGCGRGDRGAGGDDGGGGPALDANSSAQSFGGSLIAAMEIPCTRDPALRKGNGKREALRHTEWDELAYEQKACNDHIPLCTVMQADCQHEN